MKGETVEEGSEGRGEGKEEGGMGEIIRSSVLLTPELCRGLQVP